jgi:hypothetical protein
MAQSRLDLIADVSETFAQSAGMCPDKAHEKLLGALAKNDARIVSGGPFDPKIN